MALGSIQPLREMSTRDLPWRVKVAGALGMTALPPSCADCLNILGASTTLYPQSLPRPEPAKDFLSTVVSVLICI